LATTDFQVSFWGVRGSLPVPGPATVKFGGNTSCVQVQVGERLIILDAGTGIYKLGQHLIGQSLAINGEIFITHTHWDHIQGFPFFAPAFIRGNHFILYGPGKVTLTFADLMKGQMMYDHFQVTLDQMGADIEFRELQTGMVLDLGDGIAVSTVQNNHPGGSRPHSSMKPLL
jgi:phosphoribosyl 1,2-cyclic phosphodiesterase